MAGSMAMWLPGARGAATAARPFGVLGMATEAPAFGAPAVAVGARLFGVQVAVALVRD
jgi:hypothetical protein